MADFDKAFEHTMKFEGIFSDHPNDSGEYTVYGISKRWYPEMFVQRDPTREEAQQFYLEKFWRPLSLTKLSSQLIASEVFDTAVNAGQRNSAMFLQKAYNALRPREELRDVELHELQEDGFIGPVTIRAVNTFTNRSSKWKDALFNYLNFLQADYYVSLGNGLFLRGWFANRIGNKGE